MLQNYGEMGSYMMKNGMRLPKNFFLIKVVGTQVNSWKIVD